MWKIGDVKRSAKAALKSNYWISFVVVIALGILCAGICGAGSLLTFKVNDSVFVRSFVLPAIYYMDPVKFIICMAVALTLLVIAIALEILFYAYFSCPVEVGAAKYFIEANKGNAVAGNLLSSFRKGAYKPIVKAKFNKEVNLVLWGFFACIPGAVISVLSYFVMIPQNIFNIIVIAGTIVFAIPFVVHCYQWRLVEYIAAEGLVVNAKAARKLSKKLMKGNCWKSFFFDLSFIGWFILSIITLGIVAIFWSIPYKTHANAALYAAINKKEEPKKEEPIKAEAKKPAKKAPAKKPVAKKPAAKKAPAKKATPAKKAEPAKVLTPVVTAPVAKPVEKKVEPKNVEPKKEEPKKATAKKPSAKKAPAKKAEPAKVATPVVTAPVAKPVEKNVEPKKVEPKKAPVKNVGPKTAPTKKVEPKKAPVKKVGPKTAPAKKAEPKKVEPKNPVAEKTSK